MSKEHIYDVEITVCGKLKRTFSATDKEDLRRVIERYINSEAVWMSDLDGEFKFTVIDRGEAIDDES